MILLIQLVLFPVLLLVADIVVGMATGYDAAATRTRIEQLVVAMQTGVPEPGRKPDADDLRRAALVLNPYTGFGPESLTASHSRELERLEREPVEGEFRILILGGSVAAGFGYPESGGTSEVARQLHEDPRFANRRIRFLSEGYGAYKQPQQLNLASLLLGSGVRPHVILSLDGFNEVALTQENAEAGMNPNYPSFSQWVHLTRKPGLDGEPVKQALFRMEAARESSLDVASWAERLSLYRSSLLGPRVIGRLQHERRQFDKASKDYLHSLRTKQGFGPLSGPVYSKDPAVIAERAVEMWRESTRSLDAICRERGILFVNVLQPTLHDEGSKVLTEAEVSTGGASKEWVRGVRLGYPLLREAGRELAQQGLHYLDASQAFHSVKRTVYYDACHFDQFGYTVLGNQIGRYLLEALPAGELPD